MNRDVQRTFVLLRQLGTGRESGYARAETREGKVKLNLVVQGFDRSAQPQAFSLTEEGVQPLGRLNMDARGQGGIVATLSPSDLRRMQMIFVAYPKGENAAIPLAGAVGRGGWVDWAKVRSQAAEALHPQKIKPVASNQEEAVETMAAVTSEEAVQPSATEAQESTSAGEESKMSVQPEEQEQAPVVDTEMQPEEQATQPEVESTPLTDVVVPEPSETDEKAPVTAEPEEMPQDATSEEDTASEEAADPYDQPAQEDPFVLIERSLRSNLHAERCLPLPQALCNVYWPQALWPMHDLFQRFEEVTPFEGAEDTIYIRVPLGDAYEDIDHYLVGAKIQDGWVVGIGYLIPGAQDPALGMPGYVWKDGYWQAWQYVDPQSDSTEGAAEEDAT